MVEETQTDRLREPNLEPTAESSVVLYISGLVVVFIQAPSASWWFAFLGKLGGGMTPP